MPKKHTKTPAKKAAPAPKLSRKPLFAGQPQHKPLPPPPPVAKRLPPPPPPKPKLDDFPPNSVLRQLPHRPVEATHIEYHREATDKEPGLTVVVPFNSYGDFSSCTSGRVRWGKLRYGDDFVPLGDDGGVDPTPPKIISQVEALNNEAAKRMPPPPPRQPGTATGASKREGVCAVIDELILKADGKLTAEQIRDTVLKQFPGRDATKTLATVRIRPTHMRAKGLAPKPFKKCT